MVTSRQGVKADIKQEVYKVLVSFANILDPDQARQNDGPALDPNCLTR